MSRNEGGRAVFGEDEGRRMGAAVAWAWLEDQPVEATPGSWERAAMGDEGQLSLLDIAAGPATPEAAVSEESASVRWIAGVEPGRLGRVSFGALIALRDASKASVFVGVGVDRAAFARAADDADLAVRWTATPDEERHIAALAFDLRHGRRCVLIGEEPDTAMLAALVMVERGAKPSKVRCSSGSSRSSSPTGRSRRGHSTRSRVSRSASTSPGSPAIGK